MTQKRKVLLVTLALIFFSGLIISYKSHQVSSDYRLQLQKQKEQDVAYWAAEVLMEKVKILEASVSSLDKATVQILKRMDVRYFAYAFKSQGQWKIKWKVIGGTDKKEIVTEVNSIPFAELSGSKRNWFNEKEKLALVSPVKMAKSEQLKSGFLVFGLHPDFFSGILKVDPSFEVFTFGGKQAKALFPEKKKDWLVETNLMSRSVPIQAMNLDYKGIEYTAASYFASDIQLWLVRLREASQRPYMESTTFQYFLMAILLCFALVFAIFTQLVNFSESLSAQKMRDTRSGNFGLFASRIKSKMQSLGDKMKSKKESYSDTTDDTTWMDGVDMDEKAETIDDFAAWVEETISGYRKPIVKAGIQLHTNIPKNISAKFYREPTEEFIHRLIENSMKVLVLEDNKTIDIELITKGKELTFSYSDSRTRNLPTIEDPNYLLEIEKPLEDINGIVSYGQWLFSNKLHSANNELSIFLELERVERLLSKEDLNNSVQLDRIVIEEDDEISLDEFEFKPVTPMETTSTVVGSDPKGESEGSSYVSQSIDDIISSFEMNNFEFSDEEQSKEEDEDEEIRTAVIEEKDVVHFQAGDFKIKIRSPKKRDEDVSY